MKQKEIRVLMVEPGKHPRESTIANDLDSLQKAVSIGCEYQGLIEIVGLEDGACILCNVSAGREPPLRAGRKSPIVVK